MSLSKDEKHQVVHAMYPELNDMQSADYVAPHLVTKTMVGRWASLSGSEWKYTCCGATSTHANSHLQAACACGVMWKRPADMLGIVGLKPGETADYPNARTYKTLVGLWTTTSEEEWAYHCCGLAPALHSASHLQGVCPCGTAWKRPDRTKAKDGTTTDRVWNGVTGMWELKTVPEPPKPVVQKTELTLTNDGDPEKVARKVKAALDVPDINCRKCGKTHSIYGCATAVCIVCHKPVQMGSDTASPEVPGRYRHEACVEPKKKSQFRDPTPTYDDYKKVDTYPAFPETFNAPSAGWAKDLQNEYNRILQKALDSMGLPIPNCPRPSTCAHAEGFPLDSKTWSCVACQREIHATTAKNAKTWGLNGPTDRPQFTPDAFDLFSDELWLEALKCGEHRNPAENRLVFLTLNTMWKDPEYADVRKKWEATVERMRARR